MTVENYCCVTSPPIAPGRHSHGHIFRQDRFDITPGNSQDFPSPPVLHRPATSRDLVYRRGRLTIEQRGDPGATSKSTASGTSLTLTSSASLMSSQTDDSEDESKRRVSLSVSQSAHWLAFCLLHFPAL